MNRRKFFQMTRLPDHSCQCLFIGNSKPDKPEQLCRIAVEDCSFLGMMAVI